LFARPLLGKRWCKPYAAVLLCCGGFINLKSGTGCLLSKKKYSHEEDVSKKDKLLLLYLKSRTCSNKLLGLRGLLQRKFSCNDIQLPTQELKMYVGMQILEILEDY
jgi:hypothetical protein